MKLQDNLDFLQMVKASNGQQVTACTKLIYLFMKERYLTCKDLGEPYTDSAAYTGDALGLSSRTVQSSLALLQDIGVIEVIQQRGRKHEKIVHDFVIEYPDSGITGIHHYVYIMDLGGLIKVGVTNNIHSRRKVIQKDIGRSVRVLECCEFDRSTAFRIEKFIHTQLADWRVDHEKDFGGRTECFQKSIEDVAVSLLLKLKKTFDEDFFKK